MNIQGIGALSSGSLDKTQKNLTKILEQLATAQRINSASDDAAGLAVSTQLSSQVRGMKTAEDNVSYATDALNIADSTAGQVTDMLQRQRELALQASNGTLNNSQRSDLDVEYQSLTQEINRISGNATYNTQNVANGTGLASGTAQVQAGPNAGDTITLAKVDSQAGTIGISATSIATMTGAASAISAIDTALNSMNTQRATVGAETNRLGYTSNELSVAETNTQAAESVISDQDMAEGISAMTSAQLLSETGTAVFAHFNQIASANVLKLIQ